MKHGMIRAPQPEMVEIGAAILARSGDAFDATIACAFAQGVRDTLICGIGGGGFAQIHEVATGVHSSFDFMGEAPTSVRTGMWEDRLDGETRGRRHGAAGVTR